MHDAVRLAEADGATALAAHIKTRGTITSYVIEIAEAGHSRLVSVTSIPLHFETDGLAYQ